MCEQTPPPGDGGGGSASSTPDPNPLGLHPATAFRRAISTSLLSHSPVAPSTRRSTNPWRSTTLHQQPSKPTSHFSIHQHMVSSKASTSLAQDVGFRAAGWATAPLATGSSQPRLGNAVFYPPSTLRGRTGAFGKGRLSLWQMSPVSGDLCLGRRGPAQAAGTRLLPSSLFAVRLTDSRTRVRAALSPELKAWAGGILSWPRHLASHDGGQVLTMPFSVCPAWFDARADLFLASTTVLNGITIAG